MWTFFFCILLRQIQNPYICATQNILYCIHRNPTRKKKYQMFHQMLTQGARKRRRNVVSNKNANWMFTWNKCSIHNKRRKKHATENMLPYRRDAVVKKRNIQFRKRQINSIGVFTANIYQFMLLQIKHYTFFLRGKFSVIRPMTTIFLFTRIYWLKIMYFVGISASFELQIKYVSAFFRFVFKRAQKKHRWIIQCLRDICQLKG